MNRRQFIASITATAVCPAADMAVISVANKRLPLLIAAGDPVGEIAAGWKPIGAAALEVMKFARSNRNLVD